MCWRFCKNTNFYILLHVHQECPLRATNRAARSHGGKAMRIVQHQKKSVPYHEKVQFLQNRRTASVSGATARHPTVLPERTGNLCPLRRVERQRPVLLHSPLPPDDLQLRLGRRDCARSSVAGFLCALHPGAS